MHIKFILFVSFSMFISHAAHVNIPFAYSATIDYGNINFLQITQRISHVFGGSWYAVYSGQDGDGTVKYLKKNLPILQDMRKHLKDLIQLDFC